MGYIADNSRKFFHPAAINEMLSTFLPQLDGTKLDVRLSILEMRHFTDILSGHLVIPLLSNDIPPVKPPTTLPPHVVPRVGVAQLLQVRRTDVALYFKVDRDAYQSRNQQPQED